MTSNTVHTYFEIKIWDQKKEMRRDQITCVQIIWDHFNVYEIEIRKMRYCWDQRSASEIEIRKMRYSWDQWSASEIEIRNMRYCWDRQSASEIEIRKIRYCWDQRSASEIEIRNMRYCLELLRSEKAEITRSKKDYNWWDHIKVVSENRKRERNLYKILFAFCEPILDSLKFLSSVYDVCFRVPLSCEALLCGILPLSGKQWML